MFAGARAIAAAWALLCASLCALLCAASIAAAQPIVPPADQPGRERERFEIPSRPLSQAGAVVVPVPGLDVPPGAELISLRLRGIEVVGATVYTAEQLSETYADLIGKVITLKDVYDVAQKITAKY